MDIANLLSNLIEFGFDGLIRFPAGPLAAPSHQGAHMAFELGEEHSGLRLLWVRIGHRSPESANSGDQLLCRHPLDEQRYEVAHRSPLETAVYVGNDSGDDPRADSGKIVGKPPGELFDLLILIICCHGSWSPAPLRTVKRREFDWGSMPRSVLSRQRLCCTRAKQFDDRPSYGRLRAGSGSALTVHISPNVGPSAHEARVCERHENCRQIHCREIAG
ncbi:hypothetical protein [Nocardia tengchongensis]